MACVTFPSCACWLFFLQQLSITFKCHTFMGLQGQHLLKSIRAEGSGSWQCWEAWFFIKNLSPKLYLCDRACVKFGNKMTSTFFHLRWNENNNVVLQWNNSHYLNQLQLFLWTIYVIDLTENNHKILKYLHNNNYRMSV